MAATYLTTEELAERIKYDQRTIRERLKDSGALHPSLWGQKDPLHLGTDRRGHVEVFAQLLHDPDGEWGCLPWLVFARLPPLAPCS